MQSTSPPQFVDDRLLLAGIGYEKCGTTTAALALRKDGRFSVPKNKELFFFNINYSDDIEDYLRSISK